MSFTVQGIKQGTRFVPATEYDASLWHKVENREISITIRQPRNAAQHRMAMALFQLVADQCDCAVDDVIYSLKKAMGLGSFYRVIPAGRDLEATTEAAFKPDSISFSAMTGPTFKAFFDKAVPFCAGWLGMETEALIQALEEINAGLGLCKAPDCGHRAVHRHHIFPGSARRERSERLGFVIDLCMWHHLAAHGEVASGKSQEEWRKTFMTVLKVPYDHALELMNRTAIPAKPTRSYKLKEPV